MIFRDGCAVVDAASRRESRLPQLGCIAIRRSVSCVGALAFLDGLCCFLGVRWGLLDLVFFALVSFALVSCTLSALLFFSSFPILLFSLVLIVFFFSRHLSVTHMVYGISKDDRVCFRETVRNK